MTPTPQQSNPGTLFTTNPNEISTARTTPSAADVVAMLAQVWTALTQNGARTLTSQFMVETGGGKFCFNWNLGNVKSGPNDSHMYLHNVWECDTPTGAATQVQNANGLAHIATPQEIAQHGWSCNGAVVVFQPPHPQCRFRAYPSLAVGAGFWLGHHQRIAQANPAYLVAINAGDTAQVAHILALSHYYTAPEAGYASGMARQKTLIDQALGPIA